VSSVALTLVTGFPGFIGRRLVAHLIGADPDARVVALVEERMLSRARDAAAAVDSTRVELLAGDISAPRLGLSGADHDRLRGEIRTVFHLAAIYNLSVPLAVAQAINVEGTGQVLELCERADALERLVYVSTAYVAGRRTGVVYEHELVMGQGFKNHYESTKFQAEVWVRERMRGIPTTILRPAIVVGDSRTGATDKFDGPYYILRAIAVAHRLGRPMAQFGRADAAFNVVPVDYVVAATAAAAADPATIGETLHLVDPSPLSTRQLVELLSREYTGRAPRGSVPPRFVERSLRVPRVRQLFSGTPPESIAYLNHPVQYDARRAVRLLGAYGLEPPRFGDYVGPLVRFFREHAADPAFVPESGELAQRTQRMYYVANKR
jgi:thioester reductase-like protein